MYGIVCHQVLIILHHYYHLEIHSIILICVYIYDVLNASIRYFMSYFSLGALLSMILIWLTVTC